MNAQLILNFDNQDDLLKVLQFLKDIGLDKIKVGSEIAVSSVEKQAQIAEPDAYQEAQILKGDVPQPVFSLDKYSVYEQ
ncbi:MAG: hypothetical protein AAF849_21640 [Bacteroidota bacterium]